MTAWASFYPMVLPWVPGCPSPTVDTALRNAARDLCSRTRLWVEQADPMYGDGETRQWDLILPAESELLRVERATVAGDEMTVVTSADMPPDWQEDSPDTGALSDTVVVLADGTGYVTYPVPADGEAIVIYQSLQPTMAATGVGDIVYAQAAETLAHGALARLHTIPKQSWSDLQAAEIAARAYEAAIHTHGNRIGRQARLRVRKSPI